MKRFVLTRMSLLITLIFATIPQQAHADFQYSVKFVCGESNGKVIAPGTYLTAINVLNPTNETAEFYKYFAIALPGEMPGPVSDYFVDTLPKHQALEIDCGDIVRKTGFRGNFLKGFVVIMSSVELDVVAVYTATTTSGFWGFRTVDIDIERVSPRRLP